MKNKPQGEILKDKEEKNMKKKYLYLAVETAMLVAELISALRHDGLDFVFIAIDALILIAKILQKGE